MNNILILKGNLEQRPSPSKPGSPKLPKGKKVSLDHIILLNQQLKSILKYWEEHREIGGALISVHYTQVIAKSNRLKILLSERGCSPIDSIRGAKFTWEPNETGKNVQKHVFTHYISIEALKTSIQILEATAYIVKEKYGSQVKDSDTETVAKEKIFEYKDILSKNNFLKAIIDCFYVEYFDIDRVKDTVIQESIITIYKTGIDTKTLLRKFGINIYDDRIIDETTLRLNPDEVQILLNKASYLIAMNVSDLAKLTKDDVMEFKEVEAKPEPILPSPTTEPVIGVIDTQFDTSVYFSEWVEYHNMLDKDIPLRPEDYYHGTEVTSIIVDGPRANPKLEDGCGNFRVRHFGVATNGPFSSFSILRLIREIVVTNRDIKVWNLSLGSVKEIASSFISPEAAELDRIQNEYDVIFIVAGTNKPKHSNVSKMKIGAPADSLNSLVVNSVRFDGKAASYTRVGPVLSFFHKPDLSYYGGDGEDPIDRIAACRDSHGAVYVAGTSVAAPWITRKMAYLIYIMGLSREVAKALIIDSAAGWNRKDDLSNSIGYGIVPTHISDIIHTKEDEFRFIITGTAEKYETYTYNLPVPVVAGAHPFYARATLVYFPYCNRNQGVDYTGTELDIHFGRINSKYKIETINTNNQAEEGLHIIYEEDARKQYRKWDNIKYISDIIKGRAVPRKAYNSGLWGLSIKSKERMGPSKRAIPFGVVVTLKEMNGINRIDEFKRLCMARGWLISQLDVRTQIDIYQRAEEEIRFE